MKQIFRKIVPGVILLSLLEKICLKTEKYFFIDYNCYKTMIYKQYHIPFQEKIKKYYHNSKQFYVERKFTYNSFITIIRQICKVNNIDFTSQIKYNESKYNIDYFVYHQGINIADEEFALEIRELEEEKVLKELKEMQIIEEVIEEVIEYVMIENDEDPDK
jgi:hypothetical protein